MTNSQKCQSDPKQDVDSDFPDVDSDFPDVRLVDI